MDNIVFNDNTNYVAAERAVKLGYSELMASKCSCNCGSELSCTIGAIFTAIDIDKDTNEVRWKSNIRLAYKLLKSNCGC